MDEIDMTPIEKGGKQYYTAEQAAFKLHTTTKYVRTLAVSYEKFECIALGKRMLGYEKAGVDAYEKNKQDTPGRPKGAKDTKPRKTPQRKPAKDAA